MGVSQQLAENIQPFKLNSLLELYAYVRKIFYRLLIIGKKLAVHSALAANPFISSNVLGV